MVSPAVEGVRVRGGNPMLLEREAELAVVADALADVRDARGSLLLIEGPAGIGKTSLLQAACDHARERAARVVTACGFALEGDFPFGVVRQMFEPVRAAASGEEWAIALDGAAGLAARVFDSEATPPVEADTPYATLHGLYWLAANLAVERPLVVAVDDVQWADPPSLRWLAHLARRLQDLAVLLVLARRSGPDSGNAALLDDLRGVAHGRALRLEPLTPAATQAVVRARLGEGAGDDLPAACHAATGGNPFLVHSLVRALGSDGALGADAIVRVEKLGPEPVARAVARRIVSLPEGAEALTRALAVFGGPVPVRHAAALAGLEPQRATQLADALRAAAILSHDATLEFVHPIVRTAIYESIAPGERALRHAQAAELLAREEADPERVALHLLRSEPAGSADVVERLRAAARSASGRGAPDAAAVYLRRALHEPPGGTARPGVLTELGLALAADRQASGPDILREAVELSATPGERADRALLSARVLGIWGYPDTAIQVCREALASRDRLDPAEAGRLEAEFIANSLGTPAGTAEAVRGAREHARDPATAWRIAAAFAETCLGGPGRDSLALVAPVLTGEVEPVAADSLLAVFLLWVLVWNDELAVARAACDAAIDAAQMHGSMSMVAHVCCVRAVIAHRCGQLDQAISDGRLALEFKLRTSPPLAVAWAAMCCIEPLVELGQLDEADAVAAQAAACEPPAGYIHTLVFRQARGRLRAAQARFEEALDDLLAVDMGMRHMGIEAPGLATWRTSAVDAFAATGQPDQAARLATEQLELARRVGAPCLLASALRVRAATIADDLAEPLLAEAANLLQGTPASLELAHTLAALGALHRRAGRRTQARAPLLRARELADQAGAAPLADRAHAELLAAGARPRRTALTGVDALTAAERRVAELAAQGLTNRQIAQRLFVTQPTVETHLRHTFQKLDIESRTEIAGRLG